MFLKGKSAVVTGSTSGIGLAYARAFAAEVVAMLPGGRPVKRARKGASGASK